MDEDPLIVPAIVKEYLRLPPLFFFRFREMQVNFLALFFFPPLCDLCAILSLPFWGVVLLLLAERPRTKTVRMTPFFSFFFPDDSLAVHQISSALSLFSPPLR